MNKEAARKISEFVRLCDYDEQGKLLHAVVPGHEAQWYQVEFDRQRQTPNSLPTVRCHCHNSDEGEQCKGNRHGVCYHSLGALIAAAKKKGFALILCETLADAQSVLALVKTHIVQVTSKQSGKSVFAVHRPLDKGKKT